MNNYKDVNDWHKTRMLEHVNDRLNKRQFNSMIINSADEICIYIMGLIPADSSVGLGGSVTIRDIGIDVKLRERGNTMFDSWGSELSPEVKLDQRKKAATANFYITSTNAVTLDGEIVNIDGFGNRVASMAFGPDHVIVIAGYNKIAKDLNEAIWRIKNFASPMNAKRLERDTPCVRSGFCMECGASKSICRVTTILHYKPSVTDFTFILTPMELGF